MRIAVKNMVCDRCIESVSGILANLSIPVDTVQLGMIETRRNLPNDIQLKLAEDLHIKGFELITDRETELVQLIKASLLDYISHLEQSGSPKKLSIFVAEKMNYNYSYLSNLFTVIEGITVETFLIRLKIERVKELLSYRRWTLSEIAWRLKYSSVQYLSNQFKKVTGKTVSEYLNQKYPERKTLDRV